MTKNEFFVVVPFYNEEKCLGQTLESLVAQSDQEFSLILVDNNSTDRSLEVVSEFSARHSALSLTVLTERQKGTGVAVDTGFREAIARGARYIARTDADCLPAPDWIANIKEGFAENLEFVIGKIKPRTDEGNYTTWDKVSLPVVVFIGEHFGRLFRHGKQFKYPYIMVAGNNLALTAELYEKVGGFPRTCIEETHEDKALGEKIRVTTAQVAKKDNVLVYNSIRRVKKYGYWHILMWYWDHKYKPAEVDIR